MDGWKGEARAIEPRALYCTRYTGAAFSILRPRLAELPSLPPPRRAQIGGLLAATFIMLFEAPSCNLPIIRIFALTPELKPFL